MISEDTSLNKTFNVPTLGYFSLDWALNNNYLSYINQIQTNKENVFHLTGLITGDTKRWFLSFNKNK